MSTVTAFTMADILFTGPGALAKVPDSPKGAGLKKPLIVADKGIVKVGLARQLEDVLSAAGLSYALYDGTVPNPTDDNVGEAFALYAKEGFDCQIGMGGGSSMDTAKGCGVTAPAAIRRRTRRSCSRCLRSSKLTPRRSAASLSRAFFCRPCPAGHRRR